MTKNVWIFCVFYAVAPCLANWGKPLDLSSEQYYYDLTK